MKTAQHIRLASNEGATNNILQWSILGLELLPHTVMKMGVLQNKSQMVKIYVSKKAFKGGKVSVIPMKGRKICMRLFFITCRYIQPLLLYKFRIAYRWMGMFLGEA